MLNRHHSFSGCSHSQPSWGSIIRKHLVPGSHLTDDVLYRLNDIGCIDDSPHLSLITEQDLDSFPHLGYSRILRAALLKLLKIRQDLLLIHCLISGLKLGCDFLVIFPKHRFETVPDYMDDTQLDCCFRRDRLYNLGKTVQFIYAGYLDIIPSFPFDHDFQSEFRPFIFGPPVSQ